jgi:hypothetical protein
MNISRRKPMQKLLHGFCPKDAEKLYPELNNEMAKDL